MQRNQILDYIREHKLWYKVKYYPDFFELYTDEDKNSVMQYVVKYRHSNLFHYLLDNYQDEIDEYTICMQSVQTNNKEFVTRVYKNYMMIQCIGIAHHYSLNEMVRYIYHLHRK